MYQWTPEKCKLLIINRNISTSALAGLLGTTRSIVQHKIKRLGIRCGRDKMPFNTGIPGLMFCTRNKVYIVRSKRKYIGSSTSLRVAIDILDDHNRVGGFIMSKTKLEEVYNIVNVKWIDFKENGRKNNIGRVTELTMPLIKIIHKAVKGGKTSSWAAYSIEIRSKHGISCSQSWIMRIVEAIEKVFSIKVTKFNPRAKPKRMSFEPDLEWNHSINAIFGGVKCNLT